MIRKIMKIMGIFVLSIVLLLLIAVFVFYRSDLELTDLEPTYFTENSHYITLTIASLDQNDLEIDIHYQDVGSLDDPVIVLLHGAFASSHTFIAWSETLIDSGYRVIMIDLPYHGLSGGFSDQVTSLRRSAHVVKALLDALLIDQIVIGGNSMGGGVSWYFTSIFHGVDGFEVTGLVLIDAVFPYLTGGRPMNSIFDLISNEPYASFLSKMTPKFLLGSILGGVYGSESELESDTLNRYYDLLRRTGNRKAILVNTQEDIDTSSSLSNILSDGIPVLIMWGNEDSWIPVSTANLFKEALELSDLDIIIYEGLGHVPMEENPDLTVIDLLSFLRNL
jgi:pimeloyl-ACP methyl ester carboxylesterase